MIRWSLRAAIVALLVHQSLRLSDPAVLGTTDFVEYWSAGRLNAQGCNPYSAELLFPLQRPFGCPADGPILMYNPPWTLAFLMPFGLIDFGLSRLLWLLLNVAVVLLSCGILWRLYGGSRERQWVAWAVGLCLFPTLIALRMGQIGPLVLLGAVGFLWAIRRGRDGLAGAATVLIAIKPHLLLLFWFALLLWTWNRRRWRVLLGAIAAGMATSAIALVCNPRVFDQYVDLMIHRPPAQCLSPSLGSVLRLAFGAERFHLQFVPPLVGLAWLVPYWRCHDCDWDWIERMPMLLFVSLLTAAYGAWAFDLVVLLPALLYGAAIVIRGGRPQRILGAALAYLLVNGLALSMDLSEIDAFWFLWMTPTLMLLYIFLVIPASSQRKQGTPLLALPAGNEVIAPPPPISP